MLKNKVMFCTPTYDHHFCVEYVTSIMATGMYLTQLGIDCRAKFCAGLCFIDLARNDLVKQFLASDCTDLFFVDADVGWDYKVIPRMLHHPQLIVGGLVPKKWDLTPYHDNAMSGKMSDNGLLSSDELPTAFMRIKREVFDVLDAAYPHYKNYETLDKGTAYFQTGFYADPETGQPKFLGEDIFFCRQWCRLGEKVWIDPDIEFTHRGGKSYRGSFLEHCYETGKITKLEEPCQAAQVSLTGT